MTDSLHEGDFDEWAAESLTLSETFVYPDFVEGEDPDQDYIDAGLATLEQHMMNGASRLAALIEDIYGSSSMSAIKAQNDDAFLQF